ncbi:hypothetical protein OBBRIDRAFT_559005 [Obba rivulosa]|uniref:Uncharacterized protein n=1 Tax=Obba rivulosa TaxID=1052685 RepID=A0A8E2AZI8_9APHY|nr:hypothetical protein OBBRIDRAFT_559005 [Obba rivulosa]
MEDNSSDILGGRLPVQRRHSSTLWIQPDSTGKLYAGFALVVIVSAFLWLKPYWYSWRNERYRMQVRRRHGIPDDDRRPFSVAFAAANARKQREAKEKELRESQEDGQPPSALRPRSPLDGQALQEDDPQVLEPYVPSLYHPQAYMQGPFEGAYREPNGFGGSSTWSANDYNERSHSQANGLGRATSTPQTSQSFFVPGQLNTPGREDTSPIFEPPRRKHVREEEELSGPEKENKKSRRQEDYGADDGLDSDDDMTVDQTPEAPRRGFKRAANRDEDEGLEASRPGRRDKRARKVSHETLHEDSDHSMDSDEQVGETTPAVTPSRGKKRDRVEAGSSFGGDDSFLGEEDEKARRHRKRRTLAHKKVEPASRGKKRGRAVESDESDGELSDQPRKQASRRKRGRRSLELEEDDMDVDAISQDPLCKGRHIGEEWESHGTHFKVGVNGQRLRLELVKRSRTRFPMPKDSEHPDKEANIDIYVETWLTEDEYQAAKEKRELAWQAPTKTETIPPVSDVPESPMSPFKIGKGLLWQSELSEVPETPLPQRGPFKQSIASNVGIHINPFEQFPMTPARRVSRISSVHHVSAPPSAPDSPKVASSSKSYSKWEKQDLEAAAMSKIREKLQREAAQARWKDAAEAKAPTATKTDTPSSTTPATFSFAKPAEKTNEKAGEKLSAPASTSSNIFDKPKTTNLFTFPSAPASTVHSPLKPR